MKQMVRSRSPWAWIPTLYFAEGLPYVAVMTITVVMYKNLGLSNTDIAFYTGWLYLPWVLKPFWSPFVDLIKTKRFWVVSMQFLIAVGFAGIAFFIPSTFFVKTTLAFFWLLAFSSATHDIAADGFYILALSSGDQSFFVGIRNTFYRCATVFGQGLVVMFAGLLSEGKLLPSIQGNFVLAWSISFFLLAGLFLALAIYHQFVLPISSADSVSKKISPSQLLKDFGHTFVSFFQKDHIGLILFFLLTYRLGEAQLSKIASPFLLDAVENGGVGLSTTVYGLVYGTVGVVALLCGGVIGGILVSRFGLRQLMFPMALLINVPDLFYVWLAYSTPGVCLTSIFVVLEQFGYGFGFTAFMLFLIKISEGEHQTAHYAIGTGFMALGMMLPSMAAGWIQEHIGYPLFFVWICVCTIPGIWISFLAKQIVPSDFGKKH